MAEATADSAEATADRVEVREVPAAGSEDRAEDPEARVVASEGREAHTADPEAHTVGLVVRTGSDRHRRRIITTIIGDGDAVITAADALAAART